MKLKFILALLPFSILHCGSPQGQQSESLSTTEEPLYGNGTSIPPGANKSYIGILWPKGTVPVCFPPNGNNTAALMQLTHTILQDTWGRVAGVYFTGWNVCSDNVASNHPNTLAISFYAGGGGQTDNPAGPHANGWINSRIGANNDPESFRYDLVHEVGHALGFQHDQDRPDNWSCAAGAGAPGTPTCKTSTGGTGHWRSVYCPSDGSGVSGPIVGGVSYGPPDNDSVMSYCDPSGAYSGSKDGRLSALDVSAARTAYPYLPISSVVQRDIPKFHGNQSLLNCQYLTDTYGGISNGIIHGYDPPNVHQLWNDWACDPVATQFDVQTRCQTVSDLYGVVAGVTFGYAPALVQTWWAGNMCNTRPLITEDLCQRASDTYGIVAGYTFGTAPAEVQSWWSDSKRGNCHTTPKNSDACQHFSDLYGTVAGVDFGWAPAAAQTWWSSNGCKSSPITGSTRANRCQQLSDVYAIDPGNFAFAPTEAQTWWNANGCASVPLSSNSCQKAADLYYIIPGYSFGAAPSEARNWWSNVAKCSSLTRFNMRACNDAATRYGIIAGVTFGFAPADVQTWWKSVGCTSTPSGPQPLPG